MDCWMRQVGHDEVVGQSMDYWILLIADGEVSRCRDYIGGSCRTSQRVEHWTMDSGLLALALAGSD